MSQPIVNIRRARERFATTTDWLTSKHCFSFGGHYDPDNVGHGRLLVSNDDMVISGSGFDSHPHRDAEIITWVLSGSLVHEDSFGNRGVVYPGLAQRMSAGRGVRHSERNDAYTLGDDLAAEPVHFIQMWVAPDEIGTTPSYEQRELELADLRRGWLPVASGNHPDAVVTLGSHGSTLWVTVIEAGNVRTLPEAPMAHLYVARGSVELETAGPLVAGDSVRMTGSAALGVTGRAEAEILLWGMG